MSGRMEAYLYSSGEDGVQSATQQLTIDEGGGAQTVLLPGPAVFTQALLNLAAAANSLGLANTYAFTWNAATQTVDITGTGAPAINFTLAFDGNLHNALGFATAAGYAGATSYTGDRARALARFDAPDHVKIEWATIREGPEVEMKRYRHGRHRAVAWGNHDLFDLEVWSSSDAEADFHASYCHAGLVRYYPSALTTPYSATNPGGYVDGYVAGVADLDTEGVAEDWVTEQVTIAASRTSWTASTSTRVWAPLQYGWSPGYWLKIQGVSTIPTEGVNGSSFGLTMPAGFTEDAGALVIDDGAAVGQRVERDKGIGVGFPLTFSLLDTTATRSLMKVWTKEAQLVGTLAPASTVVLVNDTTGWNATDPFHIGSEQCTVGAVAAGPPRFTGCARGVGGFAYNHQPGPGGMAKITDNVRYFRGRLVELYAVPIDPSGYAPGVAITDDSELVFRGHISSGPDRVGENWQVEALALDRILARPISTALTGEVLDTDVRTSVNPTWTVAITFKSFNAAGADHWGAPIEMMLKPFAADAAGDLLSESEIQDRIIVAYEAAITDGGHGAELDSLAWFYHPSSGLWEARFSFDTDANVRDIEVELNFGTGDVIQKSWHFTLGTTAGLIYPTAWYSNIMPTQNGKVIAKPKDRATIQLDDALASDVPTSGNVKIGDVVYSYKWTDSNYSTVYVGGLKSVQGGAAPLEDLTGKTASFIRTDDGVMTDIVLRQLMSSGTANLRSPVSGHDSLAQQQGYGIDESLIDVTGIEEVAGSLFNMTPLKIASGGDSMEDQICPLLALSGRAMVAKQTPRDINKALDSAHEYRLSMIHTGASGGSWVASISDEHVLASESNPIEVRRLGTPATRIKVQGVQAGAEIAPIIINDIDREAAFEPSELEFKVPMWERAPFVALAGIWAKARFASDLSAREIDIVTVPWIDAEIGDLVKVTLSHHTAVDLITGAAGSFEGVARVLGSSIQLDTGLRKWTLFFGGYSNTVSLCPSALVIATDNAAAPTWIDVPIKYKKHFDRLFLEDGGFELTLYNPGSAELVADPFGYEIDGVSENAAGPYCRLSVRILLDGTEVLTTGLSRLTTPKDGDATAYQSAYLMQDGDGTVWSSGS